MMMVVNCGHRDNEQRVREQLQVAALRKKKKKEEEQCSQTWLPRAEFFYYSLVHALSS